MRQVQPEIICLQETGCDIQGFPDYARLDGYYVNANHGLNSAGRTGVAILSKGSQASSVRKICAAEEHEVCRGRFLEVTVGSTKYVSIYSHAHDPKSAERRRARVQFNECLKSYMMRTFELSAVISLDAKVALSRQDVETNTQFSGPWASRTYRDPLLSAMEHGRWVDSFRVIQGQKRRATVWTPVNFRNPIEMGYGIDFQLVSKPLSAKITDALVIKPATWETRYSDHAVTVGRYDGP